MCDQPIKLTKSQRIDLLRDEVNDVRETMWRKDAERDRERRSLNLLAFASFYMFLIGYLIGKRLPEADAE